MLMAVRHVITRAAAACLLFDLDLRLAAASVSKSASARLFVLAVRALAYQPMNDTRLSSATDKTRWSFIGHGETLRQRLLCELWRFSALAHRGGWLYTEAHLQHWRASARLRLRAMSRGQPATRQLS